MCHSRRFRFLSEHKPARAPSPVEAPLPVVAARRGAIITNCFTSESERVAPPAPGEIALIAAALKQDWEFVRRLIDAGAPVETTDEKGVTALMVAAMRVKSPFSQSALFGFTVDVISYPPVDDCRASSAARRSKLLSAGCRFLTGL